MVFPDGGSNTIPSMASKNFCIESIDVLYDRWGWSENPDLTKICQVVDTLFEVFLVVIGGGVLDRCADRMTCA